MTVDASRSCLGLATCVGPMAGQIVEARVLLTAAAPPALPRRSVSAGSLAPPFDAIMQLFRSARRYRHLPGDGPDKARQLAGDRGGDDIGRLSGAGEPAIAGTEPGLCFPGDLANCLWQLLLPEQQLTTDPRWEAVGPGRLDQQPRAALLPALVRPPRLTLPPLECSDGTRPR